MITATATYSGSGLLRTMPLEADSMDALAVLAECYAPSWAASTTIEIDTDCTDITITGA